MTAYVTTSLLADLKRSIHHSIPIVENASYMRPFEACRLI